MFTLIFLEDHFFFLKMGGIIVMSPSGMHVPILKPRYCFKRSAILKPEQFTRGCIDGTGGEL